MEGVHYDGMPDHQKEEISDPNYQYPEGESFNDVRKRGLLFLNKLPIGTHLIFTHGGVICSLLQDFGIDEMPDNWSFVGATMEKENEGSRIKMVEFYWEYPVISEDI